ncbi:MAG: HlyD family secretion protein [Firmicutes bacterium]|nr:HlyD family secretion protein [Bacillota bacterium]
MVKRYWWLSIVLVVVVVGSVLLPRLWGRETDRAATPTYIPVQATRGPLAIEVAASGKVVPAETVSLVPAAAGRVTEVLVKKGDFVHAGQILVMLDAVDATTRLRQAEEAYAVAQAKLRKVKETAALSPNQARMEVERARAAYASAQAKLDALRTGPTEEEIAQAKAAVNQAELALSKARQEYERMQRLYAQQAVTKQQLETAENSYLTAQENLVAAEAKLKQLETPAKPEEIAAAEATLAQAKVDLEIAQENYRTAGDDYEVAAAEAEAKKAYDELVAARRDAAGMVLRASFPGIVVEVAAQVGAYVGTQTSLVTLAKGTDFVVEVEVDENDITQVRVGQSARIAVTALPDKEFSGKVVAVGRYGEEVDGVVSFPVRVALFDPGEEVKAGMSADVSIIVAESPDAVRVPNGALETRMGFTTVRLYQAEGKVAYRRVKTGLRTETMTEIVEGLHEGETVAVPAASAASSGTNTGETRTTERRATPMMFFGGGAPPRR